MFAYNIACIQYSAICDNDDGVMNQIILKIIDKEMIAKIEKYNRSRIIFALKMEKFFDL